MLRLTILRITLLRDLLVALRYRLISLLGNLLINGLLIPLRNRLIRLNRYIDLCGLDALYGRPYGNLHCRMRKPVSDHEDPERAEQYDQNVYYSCDPGEEHICELLAVRIIGHAAPRGYVHETDVQQKAACYDRDKTRDEAQRLGSLLYAGQYDKADPDESERIKDYRVEDTHARKPAYECGETAEVDDVRIPFKQHEDRKSCNEQTDAVP